MTRLCFRYAVPLATCAALASGCDSEPRGKSNPLAHNTTPTVVQPQPDAVAQIDPQLAKTLAGYDDLERPDINVLLISLDSVRRDFMSCYGYDPPHAKGVKSSPNIDALAEEGVILEDYHANTSWTLPSHMSMVSGQPDLIHGVENDPFALAFHRVTLPHVLQRVGYYTAGFYTGPYVHERFGFARGFDRYENAYGAEGAAEELKRDELQRQIDDAIRKGDTDAANKMFHAVKRVDMEINRLSHIDRSSTVCTDKSIDAIDQAQAAGKPWFVLAHYFDPHYDYDPPEPYATDFDPDYEGDVDGKNFFHSLKVRKARLPKEVPSFEDGLRPGAPPRTTQRNIADRDLEHIEALYAAEIAWTDAEIGRLIDAIRDRGELDNTLVIVTADHGEEFFENGGAGHRHCLLEHQLAVPMVMRLPDVMPKGKRVKGLASHYDIFPTVMEVLGLPIPDELVSRSMLPLIDGRDDGSDRYVMARLVFNLNPRREPGVERITVRDVFMTDTLKLFRYRHFREPALGECPPERAASIRKTSFEARTSDLVLEWLDLTQHPHEQREDFSSDFSDPRVAAALRRWQEVYDDIWQRPRDAWLSFGGDSAWLTRSVDGYRRTADYRRKKYEISAPAR